MTVEQILKQCTVQGNIVKLPGIQLERKTYLDVAKEINQIGGKWKGRKVSGFVFEQDPTELLKQIASSEKRNLQKEYQFFETPQALADKLVSLAHINECHRILEPSAGRGALLTAINKVLPGKVIDCYELMDFVVKGCANAKVKMLVQTDELSRKCRITCCFNAPRGTAQAVGRFNQ